MGQYYTTKIFVVYSQIFVREGRPAIVQCCYEPIALRRDESSSISDRKSHLDWPGYERFPRKPFPIVRSPGEC
jgi:hypothetical protein